MRAYDLRHSHVSMLIASGLNIVEVARRAGHSPTMCLSTYAHVFEEFEGRTIDLEAEILRARAKFRREAADGWRSFRHRCRSASTAPYVDVGGSSSISIPRTSPSSRGA